MVDPDLFGTQMDIPSIFWSRFDNEPTDSKEIAKLKREIMYGGVPDIDKDMRVPFSKAVVRRAGKDVTLVAWGRAVWTSMKAAEALAEQGIDVEVIDLRTIVPPDMDTVFESVERTGRLLVAAEDRSFAGFVRSIQGFVVEKFPSMPTKALGQKNIPGISQSLILEDATILTKEDIIQAGKDIFEQAAHGRSGSKQSGWSYVPPRFFIS